jgi:hypothetical protein
MKRTTLMPIRTRRVSVAIQARSAGTPVAATSAAGHVLTGIYWISGLLIGLGAFGHGFSGVKPVRAALAAVPLAADIREVLWIVWYSASGSMLVFGGLIIGAWFAALAQQGAP